MIKKTQPKVSTVMGKILLVNRGKDFVTVCKQTQQLLIRIVKDVLTVEQQIISKAIQPLLEEFYSVMLDEFPNEFLLMQYIQHHCYLIYDASLLNLPHY